MPDRKPPRPTTTERILDIALRQSGLAARRLLDRKLAGAGYSNKDVSKIVKREGFAKRFAAAALARLVARSVPGALAASGAIAAGAVLAGRESAADEAEPPAAVEDHPQ